MICKTICFLTLFFNTCSYGYANCIFGNCLDGKGIYVYDDGSKYIGDFTQSQPNGNGIRIYNNLPSKEGVWKKGMFLKSQSIELDSILLEEIYVLKDEKFKRPNFYFLLILTLLIPVLLASHKYIKTSFPLDKKTVDNYHLQNLIENGKMMSVLDLLIASKDYADLKGKSILQKSRYTRSNNDFNLGIISKEEHDRLVNQINLWLIEELKKF